MDEEDNESDESKDCEDDSDDGQEEADRKVAEMLHNQQQYIQMCSSSAQLLQLLSRFVPGSAMSGQAMTLESVSDDSEESTQESESGSSSRSAVTSDDNSGCVIWAEPILTCELGSSWKPFCGDVRRLPQGVTPEDMKNKRQLGKGGLCDRGQAPGAAGNKIKYSENRGKVAVQLSNAPTTSGQKDASTQSYRNESSSNPPVTESQRLENGMPNIRVTHAIFNEAMSKISVAADTIKRARDILAIVGTGVGTGRQANNNNNPEGSGDNGDSPSTGATSSERSSCVKDTDIPVQPATEMNTPVEGPSARAGQAKPANYFLRLLSGKNQDCTFPAPILVKAVPPEEIAVNDRLITPEIAASDRLQTPEIAAYGRLQTPEIAANHRLKTTEIADSTETKISVNEENKNSQPSDHGVSVLHEDNSNPSGLSSNSIRNSGQCKMIQTTSHSSSCQRPSRVGGQLYRYPSNNTAILATNRTQQSVSLGGNQSKCRALPARANQPITPQLTKHCVFEQLLLDFNSLGVTNNLHQGNTRQTITIANFKNALEAAMLSLKQHDVKKNGAKNGHTLSPKGTLVIPKVDSLHSAATDSWINTESSDTTQAVCSDAACDSGNTAEMNSIVDGALDDLNTEVENIYYFERPTSKHSSMEVEGTVSQDELSCSEDEMDSEPVQGGSTSSTQAHVLSREVSPLESLNIQGGACTSNSRGDYSQSPCKNGCSCRPDSSRGHVNKPRGHVYNSHQTIIHEVIDKEINKEDDDGDLLRACPQPTSSVADSEHPYTPSNARDTTANSFRRNRSCKTCEGLSLEDWDAGYQVTRSLRPRKTPPGDNDKKSRQDDESSIGKIFTKRVGDNQSNLREAGDTVETVAMPSVINQICVDNPGGKRNEVDFKDSAASGDATGLHKVATETSGKATSRRRQRSEPSQKRSWWRPGKRLQDVQIGQSNNASIENEHRTHAQKIKSEKVSRRKQSFTREVLDVDTACIGSHDNVIEITINQEEATPIPVLEGDVGRVELDGLTQSALRDYPNNISENINSSILESSSPSVQGHFEDSRSSKELSVSKLAEEDTQVSSNGKARIRKDMQVQSSHSSFCGKLRSSSLGKRFIGRSRSKSKVELLGNREEASKTEHGNTATSNFIEASNTLNTILSLTPEGNSLCTSEIHEGCVLPMVGLISHTESISFTSESSRNPLLPVDLTPGCAKAQPNSAVNLNSSLQSSISSFLDIASSAADESSEPGGVSSGAGPEPSSAVLETGEKHEPVKNKTRFRRLVAHCLHPFGNNS